MLGVPEAKHRVRIQVFVRRVHAVPVRVVDHDADIDGVGYGGEVAYKVVLGGVVRIRQLDLNADGAEFLASA